MAKASALVAKAVEMTAARVFIALALCLAFDAWVLGLALDGYLCGAVCFFAGQQNNATSAWLSLGGCILFCAVPVLGVPEGAAVAAASGGALLIHALPVVAAAAAVAVRAAGAATTTTPAGSPWAAKKMAFTGRLAVLNSLFIPDGQKDAKNYSVMLNNWGKKWMYDEDLDPAVALLWVHGYGPSATLDDTWPTAFLTWYSDRQDDSLSQFSTTANSFEAALNSVTWFYNKQLSALGHKNLEKGHVRSMPRIPDLVSQATAARGTSAMDRHEDLQADHDDDLTQAQWCKIAALLLSGAAATAALDESPYMVVSALYIMLAGKALASRGEDIRAHLIGGYAVHQYEGIGPNPEGADVLSMVIRGGKTNGSGRRRRGGTMPHKNPLLCAVGATIVRQAI